MATKKKIKKATKKPGKAAKKSGKKRLKKSAAKGNASKRVAVPKKPLVAKPPAKPVVKPAAKSSIAKASGKNRKPATSRVKREFTDSVDFEPVGLGARSGGQSGDLQGLTNRAGADSESVDELLEEGNAFEAEVVKGIEDVPDADEGEIHTREVLEDDVPREYDDQ
jgi:hypothetical protein